MDTKHFQDHLVDNGVAAVVYSMNKLYLKGRRASFLPLSPL